MPEGRAARQGRQAVARVLRRAAQPMSVAEIADEVRLHVNTVRGHLELLVHLGTVSRNTEHTGGRGRPRVMYREVPDASSPRDAYRTLAAVLASDLTTSGGSGEVTAEEAGQLWAAALLQEGMLAPASSADDAVSQVTTLFAHLGFNATTEPLGDRVYLSSCPYAALRDAFPMVCDIHLGLMRGAFAVMSGDVGVDAFAARARPGLCVAHLSRTAPAQAKETS